MRSSRCLALYLAFAAAGGCSSLDNGGPSNVVIPNQTLNISKSLIVSAESIAAGALLFVIVDPLAPNWQIEQTRIDENRFRIALRKKRFTSGGDGEVTQVFYRRAEQLAHDNGSARYRVVEFSEGVESTLPIAQRVARGVIELIR